MPSGVPRGIIKPHPLKKYGEMKQNRFDCGEMFELEEEGFEIYSKTFDTLEELAADTVKQAENYLKRYSF